MRAVARGEGRSVIAKASRGRLVGRSLGAIVAAFQFLCNRCIVPLAYFCHNVIKLLKRLDCDH